MVIAVRTPDRVHATTATSFMPVAAEPPTVAWALGPGAQVLPFLAVGSSCAVSLLAEGQRRVAADFADPFPVGPSPFPREGPPVVAGAVAHLHCTVTDVDPVPGNGRLLRARVDAVTTTGGAPLLYLRRAYRTVHPAP